MQRILEDYPEYSRLAGNVSKHVDLMSELSRVVEANQLFEVSALEQDIATTDSAKEHTTNVMEQLRKPGVPNGERLRLALLYALRYETHRDSAITQVKEGLRTAGVADDQIALIDTLLQYAGSNVRGGDLFNNKSIMPQVTNMLTRSIRGVENVYTQHKSLLSKTVDNVIKGKCRNTEYPFLGEGSEGARPTEIIVFMVGGTTYEEERDMGLLREQNPQAHIILGGSTIHNMRTFLADVAQISTSHGGVAYPMR